MTKPNFLFPFTLGLSDGIITTLMLISNSIIHESYIGTNLALRVAFGSAFVGGFSYFIAEYTRLRSEISRTSKQLVLRSPSYLIKSKIGHDILIESVAGTALSVGSGFLGSMVPLSFSIILPTYGLISIMVAIGALSIMGLGIAKSVRGSYIFWLMTMIALGVIVTYIGYNLKLV